MADFKPSPAQQAFYDFVENGSGSAILEAVAGAGKTTTLVQGLDRMRGRVFLGAYNKTMAEELKAKVGRRDGVFIATFHSAGFSALRKRYGNVQVDGDKVYKIAKAIAEKNKREDLKELAPVVSRMVSMAKNIGLGALNDVPDTMKTWLDMAEHYGIDQAMPEDHEDIQKVIAFSQRVLALSNQDTTTVDFDDMVYLALLKRCRMWTYDYVLIDEAQDTNPVRLELATRMLGNNARLFAVGDACQPDGTKVACVEKKSKFSLGDRFDKNIEDVEIGDYVQSYNLSWGHSVARKVTGVTRRPYLPGPLVRVTTNEGTSAYTTDHQCIVKYDDDRWCVYLMSRGNAHRVGMSRLWHKNVGCGPLARMRAEDADAVWILETYATKKEAFAAELRMQISYQLPGAMFTEKPETCLLAQEDLDAAWSAVDTRQAAQRVLKDHGREITLPYFIRGQSQGSLRRPHVSYACNILNGSLVAHNNGSNVRWSRAAVSREDYTGHVTSLTVEKEQLYFADGILTHNCQAIYGFSGALNNALDLIETRFNATKVPLYTTYRCPLAVVEQAQEIVSHIEAFEGAKQGSHKRITDKQFMSVLREYKAADTGILCRYNKQLVQTAFALLRAELPCYIEGRAIGTALLKKWRITSIRAFKTKLADYKKKEMQKAIDDDKAERADRIEDECDTLLVCIDRALEKDMTHMDELRKMIADLFNAKTGYCLSSVHRSKGLEWDNVFILYRDELMPAKFARKPWEKQQEANLEYVAITRSKLNLFDVYTAEDE